MTAFARPVLDRLRDVRQVRIETRPASAGPIHRTIIWVVAADSGRVLARSWRGARARWYREAIGGRAMVRDEILGTTIELRPA